MPHSILLSFGCVFLFSILIFYSFQDFNLYTMLLCDKFYGRIFINSLLCSQIRNTMKHIMCENSDIKWHTMRMHTCPVRWNRRQFISPFLSGNEIPKVLGSRCFFLMNAKNRLNKLLEFWTLTQLHTTGKLCTVKYLVHELNGTEALKLLDKYNR